MFVNDNIKCVEGASEGQYPEHDSNCGVLSTQPNGACWQTGADGPHTALEAGAGAETDVDAALKRAAWEKRVAALSGCYPTESWANNFIALRSMEGSAFGNTLYAEYQYGEQMKSNIEFDNVTMVEYFNATADPWMMKNLHGVVEPLEGGRAALRAAPFDALHAELAKWFKCAGDACP